MNGIHDMGGMSGLGELGYEESEPIFHEPWEGRMYGLAVAMGAHGRYRGLRTEIEQIPAADYLRMGYYERWLTALTERLVDSGIATRGEIERGSPDVGSERGTPALTREQARELAFRPPKEELDEDVTPRFQIGQRVRVRNAHPTTHTRMPRYTRGKVGVVERDRGVFELPDNRVYFLDPRPQHVYMIRFTARELWGDEKPAQDKLFIDMWEDYLEAI